jgi:pimeloyl-ACP methyl ester carboxylesterase
MRRVLGSAVLIAAATVALLAVGCASQPAGQSQDAGKSEEEAMGNRNTPRSEPMQLDTGTGMLYGTLSLPGAEGRVPVVLIVAGAGQPLDETVLRQLQDRAPALVEDARRITAALRNGETVELAQIPADLQPLFRPNVQPYLISMFRYDPAAEIAKLEMPALVIGGSHDLQSSVADSRLLAAAQPAARLRIVEGMNHVLKQSPADPQANFATYGDPSLPLDPIFLEAVGGFLREALK